jgi:hypothetical protein
MALTYERIKQLTQAYSNDMELGAVIRKEVQKIEESRQIIKDPDQISLLDSINEILKAEEDES